MDNKALSVVEAYVYAHIEHEKVLDALLSSVGHRRVLRQYAEKQAAVLAYAASAMGALSGCDASCVQRTPDQQGCGLITTCPTFNSYLTQYYEDARYIELASEEHALAVRRAELYFAVRSMGEEAWTLAESLTRRG